MKNKILFLILGIIILLGFIGSVSANPLSFNSGDSVKVINTLTAGLKVRSAAAGSTILATKFDGSIGTIMSDSPQYGILGGINYHWYRINWGGGIIGWSADGYPGGVDYLQKSCTSVCTLGAKQCSGNYVQSCGDWNSDGCYEWKDDIPCGSNYCDGFGGNYCKSGSVYHSRTCYSRGCSSSSCYNNAYTDEQLVQSCSQGCSSGGCLINQIPTCSLSSSPRSGNAPLSVTFSLGASDSDGSISAWVLDTNGDGSADYSGTGSPPSTKSYTYATPGQYSVVFMVSDNNGANSNPCLDTINVGTNTPPTASLNASPLIGDAPLAVTFNLGASDSDGYISNWELSYGDGNSDSGTGSPPSTKSHTYTNNGTYSAVLNVYDNGNVNTFSMQTIIVNQPLPQSTLTLYIHEGNINGQIISGVRINGKDASGKSFDIQTNSNGYVTITGVSGNWSFTASKTGYKSVSWSQPINVTCRKDGYVQKEASPISLVITSPLVITPVKSQYDTSDILSAQFTIKNTGTSPVTLDILAVGGRDPDNLVIDFYWARNITIAQNTEYTYNGDIYSLISKEGTYHFFCTYKTQDGNWNTNIDLGTGLTINDREKNITVVPKYYLSSVPLIDRGGIILNVSVFPDGEGKMIPIYIPEVINGSNIIREDSNWRTVKEIEQARWSWSLGDFLLGLFKVDGIKEDNPSILPQEQALANAVMTTLASAINANSISKYKITIQQNGSESQFRAIVQQGGYPSPFLVSSVLYDLADGNYHSLNPDDSLGNVYFERMIQAAFHLESLPFGYDYWLLGSIDSHHRNEEYLYYLSMDSRGEIISTPKVYLNDRLLVKKSQFLFFNEETLFQVDSGGYSDFFSKAVDEESFKAIIKNIAPIVLVSNSSIIVQEHSSGELRAYDSNGNVTGIVNGIVREEIPFSMYDNETKTVYLSDSSSLYHYDIVGTVLGTYGLTISSIGKESSQEFNAVNITILDNMVYQYQVDWNNLSESKGTTIIIDSNGDGNFEQTILTGNNFQMVKTKTISLNKGWNLIAPKLEPTDQNTNRTISLNKGWNIFGYSSNQPFEWDTTLVSNGIETKTLAQAASTDWLQFTIYYYENNTYKLVPGDDTYLREKKGYWLFALENNLTLIFPGVGGSLQNNSFHWLSANISKGTETKLIGDAESAGWLQSSIYYYDNGYKFVSENNKNITPWRGYWLYSFQDNLTLSLEGQ